MGKHCSVTGLPESECECGACWDFDEGGEAVAREWRDNGSDGEDQ